MAAAESNADMLARAGEKAQKVMADISALLTGDSGAYRSKPERQGTALRRKSRQEGQSSVAQQTAEAAQRKREARRPTVKPVDYR